MGKHLTDSVVEHQLKQQQKISQLQDENKELKQKLVANEEQHQLKQQQEISQLQDENKELKQKLVANEEQHQLKQLQDENKELNQKVVVNEEHQLKQQQVISQLQQRLVANEGGLDSLMWNSLGFESLNGTMLSRCGRALLQLNVKQVPMPYSSKPFLAHQSGYMAKIDVAFGREGTSWRAQKQLQISLKPTVGSNDDKLAWPFRIRHTIVLVDQQDYGQNIRKTIEPDRIDGSLVEYCFGAPLILRTASSTLDMLPTMLCVSWPPAPFGSSKSYVRNNIIIIYVEVDN